MEPTEDIALCQRQASAFEKCLDLAQHMDPVQRERYHGDSSSAKRTEVESKVPLDMLLKITVSPAMHRVLKYPILSVENQYGLEKWSVEPHSLLETDVLVQRAFETFGRDFPTAIWTCSAKRCFATRAILPEHSAVFNTVMKIYKGAEALHDQIEGVNGLLRRRKRGVGGSSLVHASQSRKERTREHGTDRQLLQQKLKSYVVRVLPYLRGEIAAPDGTLPPAKPFCLQAISQMLGVHRNTLYKPVGGEPCLIDSAGVRQRKFRRIGSRKGYRTIAGDLSPEEKEHRFLMNQMFCPFTNTSVRVCNASISELYTISEPLVASIRLLVHQMCEDPSLEEMPPREHGLKRYRALKHPLNRLPNEIVEGVERHLDMILRPDPAATDGTNVCRVYLPEINTQEKLRKLIASDIRKDYEDVVLSPSSLQRMIKSYLDRRGCRISFSQADHNACPMCKSYHHEILLLHYEEKGLNQKLAPYLGLPRPMIQEDQAGFEEIALPLERELKLKRYRTQEAICELRRHNERDARIRGWLKEVTGYFRKAENDRRRDTLATGLDYPYEWCQRRNFALVTHQDDMTKVDLPHVVVNASADITRWRYDVNAHVNAITGDCTIFSHEQGSGPKNASSIMEEILSDHILTCRGEHIKIVVSDNASVGKNWLTTVVFPQYLVDQGLAEIVMIVFLENNHGKWLADMLFGQFQIRKRNSTILSVDALLQEFETINRPSGGRTRGYVVNPLGSVDFADVFESLGYETKPPKDFGFKQRNIHFPCACTPEGKAKLSPKLQKLFVNALPEDIGIVRVCTEPPSTRSPRWRQFEDRWVDVPVARQVRLNQDSTVTGFHGPDSPSAVESPLVVPLDKPFAASGPGVVSKRTAENVGFNGLSFRGKMSFPELGGEKSILVREAWPTGLLHAGDDGHGSESLRCAPENWFLRRPVRDYGNGSDDLKARYPPRNMLNALYCHGPRSAGISSQSDDMQSMVYWVPTATYEEDPVPCSERFSASEGFKCLARENRDISNGLSFLDVLRSIFSKMPGRASLSDPWLHNSVTRALSNAIRQYSELLRLLQRRDGVRPTPATTLFQAFKEDESVRKEICEEISRQSDPFTRTRKEITVLLFEAKMLHSCPERLVGLRREKERYDAEVEAFSREKKAKRAIEREWRYQDRQRSQRESKVTTKLFETRKLRPGGLDRFRRISERDKQRYAREKKSFDETLVAFDEEHNLRPVQGPLPRPVEYMEIAAQGR